jgi:hypothetical protein
MAVPDFYQGVPDFHQGVPDFHQGVPDFPPGCSRYNFEPLILRCDFFVVLEILKVSLYIIYIYIYYRDVLKNLEYHKI